MQLISRLEQNSRLDGVVSAGQRVARLIRPGQVRDALHGVWLGHPLHPKDGHRIEVSGPSARVGHRPVGEASALGETAVKDAAGTETTQ